MSISLCKGEIIMKKCFLAILMVCLIMTFTACRKETAEPQPAENEITESETNESIHVKESIELELEEGAEGVIAPE